MRTLDEQSSDHKMMDNFNIDQKQPSLRTISEEGNKDSVCRICLSEDAGDDKDPLISPCKCSGTMKHIHLKCLTEWLESK
mmetsp:Transcript_22082/g.25384  ORF Transcript_22082/g.25384 Transcript_22082/m.25384 type:complete len:80 (+) Transcript_22082:362-601(+)